MGCMLGTGREGGRAGAVPGSLIFGHAGRDSCDGMLHAKMCGRDSPVSPQIEARFVSIRTIIPVTKALSPAVCQPPPHQGPAPLSPPHRLPHLICQPTVPPPAPPAASTPHPCLHTGPAPHRTFPTSLSHCLPHPLLPLPAPTQMVPRASAASASSHTPSLS